MLTPAASSGGRGCHPRSTGTSRRRGRRLATVSRGIKVQANGGQLTTLLENAFTSGTTTSRRLPRTPIRPTSSTALSWHAQLQLLRSDSGVGGKSNKAWQVYIRVLEEQKRRNCWVLSDAAGSSSGVQCSSHSSGLPCELANDVGHGRSEGDDDHDNTNATAGK